MYFIETRQFGLEQELCNQERANFTQDPLQHLNNV